MELLPISVGIGLAISLLFTEMFGIAAGGMIVPGYIALHLTQPVDVLLTVGAGFVTWAIVHTLSSFTIIYGRRRTVLMILIGYLVGMLLRWSSAAFGNSGVELSVIGFIIPGLIAIWLDRQGVIETVAAMLTASVVVRLILILAVGAELHG
ncbi:MAG: poly-gamma-glutamate biosynthesis protein PgsC [Myxococcales bacterium]|nr:poly-gamma-glutamate biosynthesis protein PgsC [Myxococcales bacterium]